MNVGKMCAFYAAVHLINYCILFSNHEQNKDDIAYVNRIKMT